ncbi:MAG: redoxin domain-containing protein [Pirellulales bacterium]
MRTRITSIVSLTAAILFAAIAAAKPQSEDAATPEDSASAPLIDPYFLLIRHEAVRDALKLSPPQIESIDAVLRKHNPLLLAIRDVGPQGAPETARTTLGEIRKEIDSILDQKQQARLEGLILQVQGYGALLRPDLVGELKLLPRQQQQLKNIERQYQEKLRQMSESDAERPPEERQQAQSEARTEQHRRVLAVLNERQKQSWAQRLGEPFNFADLRSSPAWAPEFTEVETWLNSPALSMESLRGQVVVVHFFAFGCINCVNNYPWYREWQDDFHGRAVTMIGIHTPETQAETDVEQLREKLRDNDLRFPVAVDNQKQNWQAWSNSMWPSVYLIDKQGRVRYWWYGELDWQGAGGQKLARQRIDELLAEKSTPIADGQKSGSGGE